MRQANHQDMCRFDPDDEINMADFEVFEGNLKRLCEEALKTGEIHGANDLMAVK